MVRTEMWDLYDEHMTFHSTMQKGMRTPKGLYHLTVEVIPTDGNGHILITKRSFNKDEGAGCYEFPAGSVLSGEEPMFAAFRELYEETGLQAADCVSIDLIQTAKRPGLICQTYIAVFPELLSHPINLQQEETIGYKFVTLKQWKRYIVSGQFVPNRICLYQQTLMDSLEMKVGIPRDEEEAPSKTIAHRVHRKIHSPLCPQDIPDPSCQSHLCIYSEEAI